MCVHVLIYTGGNELTPRAHAGILETVERLLGDHQVRIVAGNDLATRAGILIADNVELEIFPNDGYSIVGDRELIRLADVVIMDLDDINEVNHDMMLDAIAKEKLYRLYFNGMLITEIDEVVRRL